MGLEIGDYPEYGQSQSGTLYKYLALYMVIILHCSILTPLQAVGFLMWYVVIKIVDDEEEKWYKFSTSSLIMVLTQVANVHSMVHLLYNI